MPSIQTSTNAMPQAVRSFSPALMPGVPRGASTSALKGTLDDLLQVMGADAADLQRAANVPMTLRRVHAKAQLFHEGQPSEAIYIVRAGTFKVYHTDEEGYEHVVGFPAQGDVMALDALNMPHHPTAATALEESSVYLIVRRDFQSLCMNAPGFSRALHMASSRAVKRATDLTHVMAAVAAEARLARFLLQHSERMASDGLSPRHFYLRMGRRDLASNLGVASETISRSFTMLASWGLLKVACREVEILDMDGLRACARSTRRQTDDTVDEARAAQKLTH
jgi:CRP/FNR family transcriptional regulator, anaerobic regulatory protein